MKPIKWLLLGAAHVGLLGLLFPQLNRIYANFALVTLIFLLLLSPLSKILRMRILILLMGFRREMGIIMGYFATVHALAFLLAPEWPSVVASPGFPTSIGDGGRIFTGLIAYTLTLPLLITSNSFSQKLLKKNWKRVHRLVYPLLFFALFHKMIFSYGTIWENAGAFVSSLVLFGGYILLKYWASHLDRIPAIFQKVFSFISDRYTQYQQERVLTSQQTSL